MVRTAQVRARCRAVARVLRARFAFSHETAAVLHGLPTWLEDVDAVHIVQKGQAPGTRARDAIRHRVRELPASDITEVDGLPVTALERTGLDCARTHRASFALTTADAVLRRVVGTTRFNWPETADGQARLRRRVLERIDDLAPARGVVHARAVVAHADGRAESPAESRTRWLVLTNRFAAPDLQTPVPTPSGCFYPDMLRTGAAVRSDWKMVALEYDGRSKYEQKADRWTPCQGPWTHRVP